MDPQNNVSRQTVEINQQPQVAAQKKKSHKYLWIIGGFIVLMIGMMIGISLG